jgi:ribosome-associated protein
LNPVETAQLVATAAEDKKAHEITILDIRDVSVFTDYFVICHGNSQTQVQSIVNHIKRQLQQQGIAINGIEGLRTARWVLIDLGTVVVHVFHKEERAFYGLERLWGDAQHVRVQ